MYRRWGSYARANSISQGLVLFVSIHSEKRVGRTRLELATPGFSVQCSKSVITDKTRNCGKQEERLCAPLGVLDAEKREILDKFRRLWKTLMAEEKIAIRAELAGFTLRVK